MAIGKLKTTYSGLSIDEDGNTSLTFKAADRLAARRLSSELKQRISGGKEDFFVEVSAYREKRSLDANAYMWALCEKIARAIGISKEEVYRKNVREAGVFEPFPIRSDALERFSEIWARRGIAWFVDVVDDSKLEGYKRINVYHGSSDYNTEEMSRLIDSVVQDAKAVGVETLTPRELDSIMETWNA